MPAVKETINKTTSESADKTAKVLADEAANVRAELGLESLVRADPLTCRTALPDAADAGRGRESSACFARREQEPGTIPAHAEGLAGAIGPNWVRRVIGIAMGLLSKEEAV